ncbi:hypothetical protein B0H34DRAFT_784675 [Crassisporium funariophilum]|nr:hypothetical protein B0H34DRAFT_784675 [Crassisporium funariophilum]
MSAGNTNILMNIWAALQEAKGEVVDPPFSDACGLHSTIDSIPLGNIPWEGFKVKYCGEIPENAPSWMTKEYDVWFRNPLDVLKTDFAPKKVFGRNKKRQYTDLMSGQWVWGQADELAKDPQYHGAIFVPCVLGSDKTTVSVGTGHMEYYPLYMLSGSTQKHVRQAHRNALTLIGFLAIPKRTGKFHNFRPAIS